MPSHRRRACEACQAAKVRCDLSLPTGPRAGTPCGRCSKAGKECVPAARRLQRDRIAELEARIETLTAELRASSDGLTRVDSHQPSASTAAPALSTSSLCRGPGHDVTLLTLIQCAAASSMATITRRSKAPWTQQHTDCLARIRSETETTSSEQPLYQMIDAERLCAYVAYRIGLCEDHLTSGLIDRSFLKPQLKSHIDTWAEGDLNQPSNRLRAFHHHIATLYLNEDILHTVTNKSTFGAPFLPEKLTPYDFAALEVTADRIGALYALTGSCHAALDIVLKLGLDNSSQLLPTSVYARTVYVVFLLLKLYIAITAPGSTYGTVMGSTELRLEIYFDELRSLSRVNPLNAVESHTTVMLTKVSWLEAWFISYKAIAEEYGRRVNLSPIWLPCGGTSPESNLGLQLQDSDYAIRPDDLMWMGTEQGYAQCDPLEKMYTWQDESPSRVEYYVNNDVQCEPVAKIYTG